MKLPIYGSQPCMIWLAASAVMLALAGCGSEKTAFPQFKIHGKVASHDKAAAGAIVVLHPTGNNVNSPYPPRGVAETDGTFVVGSRLKDDGAPEGEYAVTITWPEEQDPVKQFENTPPDRLKGRYNDAKKPKWKVQVKSGDNALDTFQID